MRSLFSLSKLVVVLVVVGLGLVAVQAWAVGTWADPKSAPPGNNADAPINTSQQDQVKGGNGLGGLGISGNFVVSGVTKLLNKVGIGTANPTQALDVNGVIVGNSDLFLSRNDVAGPAIIASGPSLPPLRFHTGGGEQARITGGGQVAIGTQTPAVGLKLDVEGAVGATAYCDSNGQNCKTITELGAGGSGGGTTGGGTSSGGDNLGNHTATQDLNLSGKNIVNVREITATHVVATGVTLNGSNKQAWPKLTCRYTAEAEGTHVGIDGGTSAASVSCDRAAGEIMTGGGGYCVGGAMMVSRQTGGASNPGWLVSCVSPSKRSTCSWFGLACPAVDAYAVANAVCCRVE